MADKSTSMHQFLKTRYGVTNADHQTLLRRYLDENPSGLNDKTKVMKELIAAAG